MNNCNFDLRNLDNFNTLNKSMKQKILSSFNLNRYKFILDELRKMYDFVTDKKILDKKMTSIFKEGCLNFNIINSNYDCNIYIGACYYLYYNKNDKEYYLYILKKEKSNDDYLGKFKLYEDLLWKKVE